MREKTVRNIDLINEIKYRILNNIDDKYDKSEGSFPYDLISPTAIELSFLHEKLNNTSELLSVENLTGENLEKRVYEITGRRRNPASRSTGHVMIEGDNGTIIERGILVSSGQVDFRIMEDSMVKNGYAMVKVECIEPGTIGNVKKGEINTFKAPVGGLKSVFNVGDITNGYEQQSDESLREEYYLFLRLPATSGNKSHYILWASEVDGVGDVLVEPLWNGNGTVRVVITNKNMGVPSDTLINDVKQNIENKRPIGADVTVDKANLKNVNIKVDVELMDGYTLNVVQKDFEDALDEYRLEMGLSATYVSIGKIGNILMEKIDGVRDYDNLTLNGEYVNVRLEKDEIPSFNIDSIEVID